MRKILNEIRMSRALKRDYLDLGEFTVRQLRREARTARDFGERLASFGAVHRLLGGDRLKGGKPFWIRDPKGLVDQLGWNPRTIAAVLKKELAISLRERVAREQKRLQVALRKGDASRGRWDDTPVRDFGAQDVMDAIEELENRIDQVERARVEMRPVTGRKSPGWVIVLRGAR